MKIYVASSWRNNYQPDVVKVLRDQGHEVYDFKNPTPNTGFSWKSIDPNWMNWTVSEYAAALEHPFAKAGFESDMRALREADLCVLVLPSGRSASWEYGFHNSLTRRCGIVYMPEACEPELMYRGSMFAVTLGDLVEKVKMYFGGPRSLREHVNKIRDRVMNEREKEAQRRSFAYGNVALSNPNVTREMVDEIAEQRVPTISLRVACRVCDSTEPCEHDSEADKRVLEEFNKKSDPYDPTSKPIDGYEMSYEEVPTCCISGIPSIVEHQIGDRWDCLSCGQRWMCATKRGSSGSWSKAKPGEE